MRNIFIVLEGCEGSGKSTQLKKLQGHLPEAVFFREPGGTEFSENEMRRLLLSKDHGPRMSAFQHMNLFFTGRADNIREIVIPAHKQGKVALTDRFDASSFAYQIFGLGGHELEAHFESNRAFMGPVEHRPSLYIILDIPVEVGMARVAKRENDKKGTSNHFDTRGPDFHSRVRDGYRRFAEIHGPSVVMIDASGTVEEVWTKLRQTVDEHIASLRS
ncbi:MAG: dTMP kinase [bacterium]|nr:dTMP kinase [bacterium]